MSQPQLRVYHGPEAADSAFADHEVHAKVQVRLGDVLPLLADAYDSERTWLRDFADEEVTIPADLHQVLLTYQFYRRPSA